MRIANVTYALSLRNACVLRTVSLPYLNLQKNTKAIHALNFTAQKKAAKLIISYPPLQFAFKQAENDIYHSLLSNTGGSPSTKCIVSIRNITQRMNSWTSSTQATTTTWRNGSAGQQNKTVYESSTLQKVSHMVSCQIVEKHFRAHKGHIAEYSGSHIEENYSNHRHMREKNLGVCYIPYMLNTVLLHFLNCECHCRYGKHSISLKCVATLVKLN